MSARLFTEVRERRGLCYSVHAAYHTLRDRGGRVLLRRHQRRAGPGDARRDARRIDAAGRGIAAAGAGPPQGPHQERPDHAAGIEFAAQRVASPAIGITWAAPDAGRSRPAGRRLDVRAASTPTWPSIRRRISPSSRSAAAPLEVPQWSFVTAVLPNGLEIVAECNAEAYSTALGFFVRTGARDETDEVAGVSHFLEHMVFKGTPTPLGRRRQPRVRRNGGALQRLHQRGEHGLLRGRAAGVPGPGRGLLADILRPSLRQEDFETEKKVILEEIQMYEDQPPFGADEKCRARLFRPPPAGPQRVGHAPRASRALSVEAMRGVLPPPLQPGQHRAGGRRTDRLRRPRRRRPSRPAAPGSACDGRRASSRPSRIPASTLSPADGHASNTPCNWPRAPPPRDADRYAAKLLAMVLGDDSGSRLYWELVDSGPGRAGRDEPLRIRGRRASSSPT